MATANLCSASDLVRVVLKSSRQPHQEANCEDRGEEGDSEDDGEFGCGGVRLVTGFETTGTQAVSGATAEQVDHHEDRNGRYPDRRRAEQEHREANEEHGHYNEQGNRGSFQSIGLTSQGYARRYVTKA